MAKINILTPEIYNLISAGEVVERPSSVLKELVENAIDALADEINIEIENGGISKISIFDNGTGIDGDDLKNAVLPHATSKIVKAEDLFGVSTLGFRGEALASIAAVSELSIISKTESMDVAKSVVVKGGEILDFSSCAAKRGTRVEVRNLFYNTPARYKFLKKEKGEERLVVSKVQELVLANPDISFSLTVDQKQIFKTDGKGLTTALYAVFDRATVRELKQFEYKKGGFMLSGYFSNPLFSKPNRTYQTTIVNGRVVSSNTITAAVERAYSPYLMKRCYPVFVLNFSIPNELVDVNVHPAKSEVRFSDTNAVFGFIFNAVKQFLASENEISGGNNFSGGKIQDEIASDIKGNQDYLNSNGTLNSSEMFEAVCLAKNKEDDNRYFENTNHLIANEEIEAKTEELLNQKIKESSYGKLEINQITAEEFGKQAGLKDNKEKNSDDEYFANSLKTPLDLSSLYALSKKNTAFKTPDASFNFLIQKNTDFNVQNDINKDVNNLIDTIVKQQTDSVGEHDKNQNTAYTRFSWKNAFSYVGQLFNTYIVLESKDEAVIIDQHAAQERILFDKLKDSIDNSYSQPMLFPYETTLNGEEFEYVVSLSKTLERIGFKIKLDAYKNIVSISEIPLILSDIELDRFLRYLISDLDKKEIDLNEIMLEKIASIACKAAIKGGDSLNEEQVEYVLDELFKGGELPRQCPHGRPAYIKISKYELEKMFKRIV